jgi:ubiquinone/menaquinone biosynthesis C-methylase UbiE
MQNSYKEFSQIYDLLMDVDYKKWTSFIMKRIEGKRKILEAACGTGGITKLLADNNYKVTAFDLSEDMLMRAYEKLRRSPMVRLLNQNMVDFKIDDKFDAAICCCDGINYLKSEEAASFFKRVYDHLNEGSKFIFDISTKYKYEKMFFDTYVYDDGDIFYVWENEPLDNGTVNIVINFFIKDQDKYVRIIEEQTQYVHTSEEIIHLLTEAGFENIEIFDDYNEEEYSDSSLRAVFTAMKF